MDKQTPTAPAADAQPPPYSLVAPPMQAMPIPVYAPHLARHGPESVIRTQVITQQPGTTVHVVTSSQLHGMNSRRMTCNNCNQTVNSEVIQQASMRTHILALSLCLVGCWPCVPCIYCANCCSNFDHYCPNCNAYQGSYIPVY